MSFRFITKNLFRLLEGTIPEDILNVHNKENPFPPNMAEDIIPTAYSIDIDVLPQLPAENVQQEVQEQRKFLSYPLHLHKF